MHGLHNDKYKTTSNSTNYVQCWLTLLTQPTTLPTMPNLQTILTKNE